MVQPALAAGAYTVDKLTDDPYVVGQSYCNVSGIDCSLRQAIELAENDGVASTISFGSSLTGVINLDIAQYGPLILTAGNTRIEALINPPAITQPPIEISNNQGSSDPAFTITSSGNTIKGLSITGFTGSGQPQGVGVSISGIGATGNLITGNYIGVKPNGTTLGANLYGVRIDSEASSNTVSGNIIVGSLNSGVLIDNANGNTLTSNLIGIGLGSAVIPNAIAGIEITSSVGGTSTSNIIGGLSSEANFISSNGPVGSTTAAGVLIRGAGTTGNTIRANLIGTDINGTGDLGNHGDGIRIASGASNNTIFGTTENPVVISGNSGYGIRITGSTTANNQVGGGVFIGLNRDRNAALANDLGGVSIDQGATGTTTTGSPTALTLIGGNAGPGVIVSGSTTVYNQITNAYVGAVPNPDAVGTITVPNAGGGVLVQSGAQKTTISGSTISGNTGFGVRLSATKTVTITGNVIGLDTARTGTVPNTGPGIDVQDGSSNTLIGGSAANANYLAGNGGAAIQIDGSNTLSTTVSSNIIGLALSGASYTAAAGNAGDGVLVQGGARSTTVSNNTIGSSGGAGVKIAGSDTMTVTLSANNIGWAEAQVRSNATGITIDSAQYVTASNNLLRYNIGSGILATGVHTVTLSSNRVYSQTLSGIQISGDSQNVQILSNLLTSNGDQGVLVQNTSQRVRIQSNSISANANGGVKLEGTTRYLGSGTDPDNAPALPNHGIDPPIYDPANAAPLRLRIDQNGAVSGWIYTDTATLPASACAPVDTCQIQFFSSDEDLVDGQGFIPLQVAIDGGDASDFLTLTPESRGFFSGQLALGSTLPRQLIFAVTDGEGNTSEFGVLDVEPHLSVDYLQTSDGRQDAAPGQTITYTLNLVNDGKVDFTDTDLNVFTGGSQQAWIITPLNNTSNLINLPANSTQVFTVTMQLPSVSDQLENVLAGLQDKTSVTAQVFGKLRDSQIRTKILTTTVLATPVVSARTLVSSGSAPPSGQVTHTHEFSNSGNVTVTLDLSYATLDPANSGFVWATSLSAQSLTIPPGQKRTVDVTVTVPQGAQTEDAQGNPVIITTQVTAVGSSAYSSGYSSTTVVSGTTRVDLVPSVNMTGNGQYQQAASFAEIPFFHRVSNTSNGPARFCLNYRSNSGSSVISFASQTPGVPISGNCFTLDAATPDSTTSWLQFKALISVTGKLLPGDVDSIDIYLTNAATGENVRNASVRDDIEITVSPVLPRIWLPMVIR
nr:right-handed parallel beta-helix repeat-containing protein [Oscillochloris sp. ZM17-4]